MRVSHFDQEALRQSNKQFIRLFLINRDVGVTQFVLRKQLFLFPTGETKLHE